MRHTVGFFFLLGLAGCSADELPPRIEPGPGAGSVAAAGSGGRGLPGGSGSGSAGNGFGSNPDVIAMQPTAGGSGGDASTPNPDSGPCEVGKFCGPLGPDPDNCGTLRLEQDVEVTRSPGNLLIVFDQSNSMGERWTAGGTKLEAARAAVVSAITSLKDSLTVGAIFFPTFACIPVFPPPPGGAVAPIDGMGQIPFQPGPQFLAAWDAHWLQLPPGLNVGTPMQEAFDRADVALQNATLNGQVAVVAFTDGQPNCLPDPMITMVPTALEPQRSASWLADKKIKTYVVGLPGAAGVQILNDVAASGGTMQYILPDDPVQLEAKLKEVISETVKMGFDTCSINLTPAADPPEKLQMVVEENGVRQRVDRMLSANAGWTLTADGTHVEIEGRLCEDAKAGRFQSITFEYGCKELPPLPPPPGPQ